MAKVKIEIKSRYFFDKVLFEYESEDNSLKKTLIEAVESGADLRGADLCGTNLRGADLYGADLRDANLRDANLRGANLRGADLCGTNLRGADLYGTNLRGTNLCGTNLRGADLYGADLCGTNLRGADLRGANLRDANLRGANLRGTNLGGADLRGANLRGADLRDAKNNDYAIAQTVIVPDGSIIGWKLCRDDKVVKLRIPEEAKRSNASGRKCRAEFAEVIAIYPKGKKRALAKKEVAKSSHDSSFVYKVGETVKPTEEFDPDRWSECAPGIHFFITREEAENYS